MKNLFIAMSIIAASISLPSASAAQLSNNEIETQLDYLRDDIKDYYDDAIGRINYVIARDTANYRRIVTLQGETAGLRSDTDTLKKNFVVMAQKVAAVDAKATKALRLAYKAYHTSLVAMANGSMMELDGFSISFGAASDESESAIAVGPVYRGERLALKATVGISTVSDTPVYSIGGAIGF